MNGSCFDIGTIQAFLDGEATQDVAAKVTRHVAACDSCALLLAGAEEENSVVFSTLGREMDTLVPTQRLWGRINDLIAEEKSRTPSWKKALAFITVNLASPSFAAAAGILIVFGVFVGILNFRPNVSTGDVAIVPSVAVDRPQETSPIATAGNDTIASSSNSSEMVSASKLPAKELRRLVAHADFVTNREQIRPQHADLRNTVEASQGYIPGEESYVKTIDGLKRNVDSQKDAILRPSSRISYERDMAVVNDSIKKMRDVVRKNPKNQAAKQVLYSSYQDKIDLLNSVAQREDLLALK